MSQKTTRASAREIRRAFGPAAVEHLDTLEQRVQNNLQAIGSMSTRLSDLEGRQRSDRHTIGAAHASLAEFCGRSFLGRLRWLFTGK